MAYDPLNRITSLTTPEGRTSTTTYTQRGQTRSLKEPSGHTTTFTYDPLNRPATQADPVATVTFDHLDGTADHTASITEVVTTAPGTVPPGTHTTTRIHDPLERVTSYTDSNGNQIQYAYDVNSNLTRITYPGTGDGITRTVHYTYNSRDLLTTLTDWLGNTTGYSYDDDGRLTYIAHANGASTSMTYDDASRLIEIRDLDSNGYIISMFRMSYDPAGKITSRFAVPPRRNAAPLRNADYAATFDDDNRITSYNGITITSDPDGNILNAPSAIAESADSLALNYDSRNRLRSAGGVSYQYDFEGNRTKVIGTQTATWVHDPVSGALSRPISRTINGQTTYYIWGNGLAYQINPDSSTSTYHFDQIGSTAALSADDGVTVTDRFQYSPLRCPYPSHRHNRHTLPVQRTLRHPNR
jgi:YD repeat-containing protein